MRRFLLVVLWLCLGPTVFAQSANRPVSLSGVVTDPSGALIPGARVHVGTIASAQGWNATADGAGKFSLAVPSGTYILVVTAEGFNAFSRELALSVGAQQSLTVKLEIASADETIEVSGSQGNALSESSNKSALVLGADQLATLSDDDTTFQQQLQAIAGGDGEHPLQVYVDGFQGGQFPPKSAIREVRINQNTYSAEYDELGFGRIEIETKPGYGKLHGTIDAFGNDSDFNSQNPFLHSSEPGYYRVHYLGNVSGSLDTKSSFFLNGEYYNQQNNAIVNATTADGLYNKAIANPQITQDYSGRYDRQWSTNNTATIRYEFDRVSQTNAGLSSQLLLPTQAYTSVNTTQTLQVGNTQVITPHLENDVRFQWQRTAISQDPVSEEATVVVSGTFTGGGSPTQKYRDSLNQYQFEDKGSWEHGKHFLRYGFRFRFYQEDNRSNAGFNGSYTFSNLSSFEAGTPSQVSVTQGRSHFAVSTADFAWYAEDEWKLRKNLTLDFGVRVETQTAIPDHFDPSPHLGFAWAIGAKEKKPAWMTLRGGGAIFYDRFDVGNLLTTVQRASGSGQRVYTSTSPGTCSNFAQAPTLECLNTTTAASQTTYTVDPHFHSSYGINAGLTAEFPLGKRGNISFNYLFERALHSYVSINANAPRADHTQPYGSDAGVMDQFTSGGRGYGNWLFANPRLDLSKSIHWWAFAIYQHVNSDRQSATNFASNSYNIHQDYGRSAYDRHFATFTGLDSTLPLGFTFSTFLALRGGQPFNITTGNDDNEDTIYNDRPTYAGAFSDASKVVHTPWGSFDQTPVAGNKLIPVNLGHSPRFLSLQVQLGRTWKFGPRVADDASDVLTASSKDGKPAPLPDPRYSIDFSVEVQNITNTVSPASRIGVLSSSNFGKSIGTSNTFLTTSAANRTLMLHTGFRF
ncbi:MAG: carboxypeptidase regulatory-like domain-containing protein [Acidobacteriaceae bacterium]|nr:carboxypeptidase regulatory-like domain-containing protein [Acidobacteriaceae bacterium]